MDYRLHQAYYIFELSNKEMAKLRKLRGIMKVVEKITRIHEVRGVTFTSSTIEVNVEGARPRSDEVVEKINNLLKEELI